MDIERVNYKDGRAYVEEVINDPRYSYPNNALTFGKG